MECFSLRNEQTRVETEDRGPINPTVDTRSEVHWHCC